MRVLLTGDRGYIGSVLAPYLVQQGHEVVGLDIGYYHGCSFYLSDQQTPHQVWHTYDQDIRHGLNPALLNYAKPDAIIHLAALSNDPLGELNPDLTYQINRNATICLAQQAKHFGVSRFLFASTQSMYGISPSNVQLDEEESEKKPLTAYAKSKWEAECALREMNDDKFCVVCFRPATVFGWSSRLRCDIAFNNLVASAYTTGKIRIHSDGTPIRPVVHIRDLCRAFLLGLEAPADIVGGSSYNVGCGNHSINELASIAQDVLWTSDARMDIKVADIVHTGEHGPDSRSYRVCFDRIKKELGWRPEWDLWRGGRELVQSFSFQRVSFTEEHFRGRMCNRLAQLKHLISTNQLDNDLRWIQK